MLSFLSVDNKYCSNDNITTCMENAEIGKWMTKVLFASRIALMANASI